MTRLSLDHFQDERDKFQFSPVKLTEKKINKIPETNNSSRHVTDRPIRCQRN